MFLVGRGGIEPPTQGFSIRTHAPVSNTRGIDQQHRLPVESSGQAETYFVDSTSTVTEYGAKL